MSQHCSEAGCHRPVRARGLCNAHYKRLQRRGDLVPIEARAIRPPLERFFERVDVNEDTGCWEWTGSTKNGYGAFSIRRQSLYAHRFAYEQLVGEIPSSTEIDHLCRNTLCVNPAHLEAVSHRRNVLRGVGPSAVNAEKTHCIRGHEFTDANTWVWAKTGARFCRACFAIRKTAKVAA